MSKEEMLKTLEEGRERIISCYRETFIKTVEIAERDGISPIMFTGLINIFLVDIINNLTTLTAHVLKSGFDSLKGGKK